MNEWIVRIRVVLKPAVNDPQGLAIRGGLHQLGFADVSSVRAGKFFEVKLAAPDRPTAEKAAQDMCRRLLANPVIEDFSFELEPIAALSV
ncbi:MAG TPA: phosphoribosylformylglycinamidine synthase subunit PurS [Chloroflexota bacterium]|nr:phosphoribosylformylglycinamidine synthase subunit PurS [Chloroflexota bacterium]